MSVPASVRVRRCRLYCITLTLLIETSQYTFLSYVYVRRLAQISPPEVAQADPVIVWLCFLSHIHMDI